MNEVKRETLGAIWRLLEQMAYTAEHGYEQTLQYQFENLSQLMDKLKVLKLTA